MSCRWIMILVALGVLGGAGNAFDPAEQCTAAVLSPGAVSTDRPVLWKNRDTGFLSNKVVFVDTKPYSYLALVNAQGPAGRQAWAGLNAEGFAIINTVAYNLPQNEGESMDYEGFIMADALRTCRTVQEFEALIRSNLGGELGSQANFGVIDAEGEAWLVEISNHSLVVFDARDALDHMWVVSNFARSGETDKGAGYFRFERATQLFSTIRSDGVSVGEIAQVLARDVDHVLVPTPPREQWKDLNPDQPLWISTRDAINRKDTSATIIVEGKRAGDRESLATLWVIPGEPMFAVALPLWIEAGQVPQAFFEGEEAPLWTESLRLKSLARSVNRGRGQDYLNLAVLANRDGNGIRQQLAELENAIFEETRVFLASKRSGEALATFQQAMAQKALSAMRAIH